MLIKYFLNLESNDVSGLQDAVVPRLASRWRRWTTTHWGLIWMGVFHARFTLNESIKSLNETVVSFLASVTWLPTSVLQNIYPDQTHTLTHCCTGTDHKPPPWLSAICSHVWQVVLDKEDLWWVFPHFYFHVRPKKQPHEIKTRLLPSRHQGGFPPRLLPRGDAIWVKLTSFKLG